MHGQTGAGTTAVRQDALETQPVDIMALSAAVPEPRAPETPQKPTEVLRQKYQGVFPNQDGKLSTTMEMGEYTPSDEAML